MPQSDPGMSIFITGLMILTSAVNILNIVAAWRDKRNDQSNQRFQRVESSIQAHDKRLIALETDAKNALTHADLEKVYRSINELAETVHKMNGQMDQQAALMRQLLNKAMGGRDE